jgi:tetratricopeptide (TPR) repeat protein
MPDVFLSYKREDLKTARKLVQRLRAEGIHVWWDPDIPTGAPWEATIEQALADAKVVLVCWSKASVASDNVRSEARWAREQGRLIQAFIEPCNPPLFFGERQGADLSGWSGDPEEQNFRTLVTAICDRLGKSTVVTEPQRPRVLRWPQELRSRPVAWIAAAVVIVALVGAGAWLARGALTGGGVRGHRIAALPLETAGNAPGLAAFATGVSDNLQSVLAAGPEPMISEADAESLRGPDRDRQLKALDVGLLLGGTVSSSGDAYAVHLHLDDPLHHATLWTADFSGPAAAPEQLQARIGAQTIAMLNCASQAVRPVGGLSDASALSLYLRGCGEFENSDAYAPQNIYALFDTFRRLTVQAPDFAPGHSALAKFIAYFFPRLSPDQGPALRQEADQEARRALAIDPKDADAYVALQILAPTSDYAKRETLLKTGLAANPAWPYLNGFLGGALYDVGRLDDAAAYLQRANASNPQSMDFAGVTAEVLVMTGHTAEGDTDLAHLNVLWPDHLDVWVSQYDSLFAQSRWDDVVRLGPAPGWDKRGTDCFKLRFDALRSHRTGDMAAARVAVLQGICTGEPYGVRISTLAALGLLDDAFSLAGEYSKQKMTAFDSPSFLFRPNLAPLRRDPRFMPLAARLGLVDYWRSTGKWPDFCSEPGLPYDCKAAAAKLG